METVRVLAMAGAQVTMAVRNVETGNTVANEIMGTTGSRNIKVAALDLASFDSINAFVSQWSGKLDILINNAGVMALPEVERTEQGIEMQFMTNYLGHFALAQGLHPYLKAAGNARVVVVSSSGHLLSPVIFDDLNYNFRVYNPWDAYGQSKSACILFAVAASQRWIKDGITVNALNPGAIQTNLQKHVGGKLRSAPELHKTPAQGAATSLLLAASPLLEGHGGHYFENCNEAPTVTVRPANYEGVAAYAKDRNNADRLWELSHELTAQYIK
ncbi:SDR family NAD(P)-dependent oxidoreductase [Flavobacterium beibuense]|uniref:SDR family NAD(P)-dependent oxidoreductase n=1 Tax=Flavobacterium beibuense TaxID=657326 RepID=UPI001F5D815F|nr:SDR family NAD(P)-dependent oxidoreductase [Flavobacterium beibuense]